MGCPCKRPEGIIRPKFVLITAIAAALAVGSASITTASEGTPFSCDDRSAAKHVKLAKGIANAGFAKKNWRRGPKKAQTRAIGDHLRCLERGKDRKAIQRHVAAKRSALRLYRAYRRITPYRCQRGPYGTWAIPCAIISCESGFAWSAYNPSGASGPYQLLGWGAPMPANTWARRIQHHRIAHRLYAGGSGRSHWVC